MPTKIKQKIVGYEVVKPVHTVPKPVVQLESMHENIGRPDVLLGSTYKIKTPFSDHAVYVTINDMILNAGTEHEQRIPYEVFINSKNMEHYQWMTALTRVISAIFRKSGDITFLVEELKGIFDPKGGYFKRGGVFMPSLVADLGCAIETHMQKIGLIKSKLDERQKEFIEEKKKEFANIGGEMKNAEVCNKCHAKSVILMDGCMTCVECGDSKCG